MIGGVLFNLCPLVTIAQASAAPVEEDKDAADLPIPHELIRRQVEGLRSQLSEVEIRTNLDLIQSTFGRTTELRRTYFPIIVSAIVTYEAEGGNVEEKTQLELVKLFGGATAVETLLGSLTPSSSEALQAKAVLYSAHAFTSKDISQRVLSSRYQKHVVRLLFRAMQKKVNEAQFADFLRNAASSYQMGPGAELLPCVEIAEEYYRQDQYRAYAYPVYVRLINSPDVLIRTRARRFLTDTAVEDPYAILSACDENTCSEVLDILAKVMEQDGFAASLQGSSGGANLRSFLLAYFRLVGREAAAESDKTAFTNLINRLDPNLVIDTVIALRVGEQQDYSEDVGMLSDFEDHLIGDYDKFLSQHADDILGYLVYRDGQLDEATSSILLTALSGYYGDDKTDNIYLACLVFAGSEHDKIAQSLEHSLEDGFGRDIHLYDILSDSAVVGRTDFTSWYPLVARSLGRMKDKRYLPSLVYALGIDKCQADTIEALTAYGDEAVGILVDNLDNENETIRNNSFKTLKQIASTLPKSLQEIVADNWTSQNSIHFLTVARAIADKKGAENLSAHMTAFTNYPPTRSFNPTRRRPQARFTGSKLSLALVDYVRKNMDEETAARLLRIAYSDDASSDGGIRDVRVRQAAVAMLVEKDQLAVPVVVKSLQENAEAYEVLELISAKTARSVDSMIVAHWDPEYKITMPEVARALIAEGGAAYLTSLFVSLSSDSSVMYEIASGLTQFGSKLQVYAQGLPAGGTAAEKIGFATFCQLNPEATKGKFDAVLAAFLDDRDESVRNKAFRTLTTAYVDETESRETPLILDPVLTGLADFRNRESFNSFTVNYPEEATRIVVQALVDNPKSASEERPIENALLLVGISSLPSKQKMLFRERLLLTARDYDFRQPLPDPYEDSDTQDYSDRMKLLMAYNALLSLASSAGPPYTTQFTGELREMVVNQEEDVQIRKLAARILGDIKDQRALPYLRDVLGIGLFNLRDKDPELCAIALASLRKIRGG